MKKRQLDKLTLYADLGYSPHPGQWRVHNSTAQRRVLACGTRWGKSTCAAMECIAALLEPRETALGWVVAPTYDLAQRIYQRISKTIATHFEHRIKDVNPRERSLTVINFAGGVSEVRAKSADNPDSLLGEGLDWIVCDEAARLDESIWQEHLSQRLIDKRGWALLISTPGDCDHWFYRLYKRGQKDRDSLYESWRSPSWENPHLKREVIEEERARLPAEIYAQQFEAEFQGQDPDPCERCGGPCDSVSRIIICTNGEEILNCQECGHAVDSAGHTLVRRDAVGCPRIVINLPEMRLNCGERVVERCVPSPAADASAPVEGLVGDEARGA